MPKLQLLEVAIHYESAGEGSPMLLLPGALGSGIVDFADQIAHFSQHYRVIAPDPRGYGQSRPPTRDFPLDFYARDAEDAAALMAALGLHRYVILGWSDGANSATILAARYPERVTQLVVWGGNAYVSEEDLHGFQSMRSLATWSERAIAPLRLTYGEELQPLWESYITGLENIRANGGDLYRSDLSRVKCHSLILHGDLDPLVPAIHPEIIRQGISGSMLYHFVEGKHNIHKRYSTDFNRIVSSFLTSHNKLTTSPPNGKENTTWPMLPQQ
jgi:valacyclovir hydrolase